MRQIKIMFTIRFFVACVLLLSMVNMGAQKRSFNTELLAHVPFTEESAGCWGFEKDGIKYAIIGNYSKTSIFSLENPEEPKLRYSAAGTNSIWREIKSYNNHVYVVTDQGQDGLTIIDMTKAPEVITHSFFKPILTVGNDTREMQRCHYNFIDEKGYLYLSGCNLSQRGVLIFDLKPDPKKPVFIGAADLAYSHDTYVRGDTMYNSEIIAGRLGFYDVRDRSNPKLMTTQVTSRAFTHNAWPSDDTKYVFTTDEKSGAYLEAYDIRDYNNIRLLDKFRPLERENDGVIPHNTHYLNGFLVTSWYTDGIRITDAHRPDNLVEVGFYDTWEDPSICHRGFKGCWGVFPYTGSNIIYGSDINNGLFVIRVDYKRACYLEGKITDENGNGVSNAQVEIVSDQLNRKFSNPGGVYKTGQALSGTFQVRIIHPDFDMAERTVNLESGVVTELNVQLSRKKAIALAISTRDKDNKPVPAIISLVSRGNSYNMETGASGQLTKQILTSTYDVFVSAWGYTSKVFEKISFSEDSTFAVILEKGYEDNFQNGLGWQIVSAPSAAGTWIRAIPNQTEYINGLIANPGSDSNDAGSYAMVTGNGSRGADCDDVDDVRTRLISPEMDLTLYDRPQLNYDIWYFNAGNGLPSKDTLYVKISNGTEEVVIDKFHGAAQEWIQVRNLDLASFITPTAGMQLFIDVSDQQGVPGYIVEAGFDQFFVTEKETSTVDEENAMSGIAIYPNPASDKLEIRLEPGSVISNVAHYRVYDQQGRMVMSEPLNFHVFSMDVSKLSSGIYSLLIPGYKTRRFVKN